MSMCFLDLGARDSLQENNSHVSASARASGVDLRLLRVRVSARSILHISVIRPRGASHVDYGRKDQRLKELASAAGPATSMQSSGYC